MLKTVRQLGRRLTARRRTVFIVTYGRSGSTVLQHIIGSIPGYQINGENGDALYGLYRSYLSATLAASKHGEASRALYDPWYGANRIDPKSYGRLLVGAFEKAVLSPHSKSRVLGFKEIRYINHLDELDGYLDFIVEFFPGARLVFNVRDKARVAKSGWWKRRPAEEVEASIAAFERAADAYLSKHPGICHKVEYDQYIEDPETLRSLFAFLEEPFDLDKVRAALSVRARGTHRRSHPKPTRPSPVD